MAKNIHEKKRRIAHYKNSLEENDLFGCHDFVSSIIEDMDNFTSTCLSNLPRVQQKDTPKNSLPSTSQTQLQNSTVTKSKQFSLSKKFPLMEKTQKTLKQIRHNRKIPKPRAHLSKMPPLKKSLDKSIEKFKRSREKVKLKNTAKSKNKNELQKPIQIVKTQMQGLSSNNELRPCISKSAKEDIDESCKNTIMKSKCSVGDSSKNIVNKTVDNSSDSEYENFIKKAKKDLPKKHKQKKITSKNKVIKKSTKKVTKKKNSLKPAKSMPVSNEMMEYDSGVSDVASISSLPYGGNKKVQESLNMYDEIAMGYNESEFSDTTSTSSLPYYRRSKRVKKYSTYAENEIFTTPDLTQLLIPDTTSSLPYYRRDKRVENSEKDKGNERYAASLDYSNEFGGESYQGESCTRDSSSESDNEIENNLNNTCNNQSVEPKKIDNLSSLTLTASASNDISVSANTCSENKPLDICENDINCSKSSLDQNNPSLVNSFVVDLTESDNECENATTKFLTQMPEEKVEKMVTNENLNETSQRYEDLDLEIIDIVIAPTSNSKSNIKGLNCESGLELKTENVDSFVKAEVQSKVPSVEKCKTAEKDTSKLEATYITNVCTENNQNICSLLRQPHASENVDGIVQNREIKTEVDDDDDVIIIDAIDFSPNHQLLQSEMNISCNQNVNTDHVKIGIPADVKQALNISHKQLPNIKINSNLNIEAQEKYPVTCSNSSISDKINKTLASEKELKLYEIACSNLKVQNKIAEEVYIQDKEINSLVSVDPKVLVQTLKKELETYERILQTEKSVGATFKFLESQQAEKLVSLKSMISASLKKSDVICNNSKNIKNEMISLLDNPTVNRSKTSVKNLQSSVTYEIASRDFKNLPPSEAQTSYSNINLVPLSSISENDIKPNLSELEQKLYSSQKSRSSENTALTFGEKCTTCGKGALAACQQCAKVFFCSNECGKKYWDEGHRNECRK